ncbi:MAG: SusF/SusE family outer membrane protein [Muribaculaceae bacterium]|nr:SusF/SusE family outer membrane protein [Muribaculaceae bacterium]
MKLNFRKVLAVVVAMVVAIGVSAQSLYIFGSFNGWDPANSIEMWQENGVYVVEDIEFGAGGNFGLATIQSSNWDEVNANRYGFEVDNAKAVEGQAMPIVNGAGAIQVPGAGIYNIYVNLSAMTVTIKKAGEVVIETPAQLYAVGNLSAGNWDPATAVELTKDGNRFYGEVTFTGAGDGYSYFALSAGKGDWTAVNASRFAPVAGEVAFNLNEKVEFDRGEAAFKVAAEGTCIINVDFDSMTVWVSSESTGDENGSEENAKPLYIFGSFNDWDPANSFEMWQENGVYVMEDLEFSVGGGFGLATIQSSDWEAINANRYGFEEDNAMAVEGQAMSIVNGAGAIQVPGAGIYNIYVDLSAMTVTIIKAGEVVIETPNQLYVVGTLSVGSWEPTTAVELTKEGNIFCGEVTFAGAGDGYSYFAISSGSGDWESVNAGRFAPATGEVAFNLDEKVEFVRGEAAFKVAAEGTYYINVDFDNMTVWVSNEAAGVETIEMETVAPIYYNLQGVEVANPQNGLYIVKQGNKVSKQLIK